MRSAGGTILPRRIRSVDRQSVGRDSVRPGGAGAIYPDVTDGDRTSVAVGDSARPRGRAATPAAAAARPLERVADRTARRSGPLPPPTGADPADSGAEAS